MKITVCGSIAFFDEMICLQQRLASIGHQVKIPRDTILDDKGKPIPSLEFYQLKKASSSDVPWMWQRVQENILAHFKKIAWSEAILVANYSKNGIHNYIGGNTLMEMGVALYLSKKIFLFNPIPEVTYKEEILAMQPIIIAHKLELIQ